MAAEDPLRRLQILQRDLTAFTENRLPNLERLAFQLDSSAEDFKRLLARKNKNDASRAILTPKIEPQPETLVIDGVEYAVHDQFRQDALQVADELDLDEMEAARLCADARPLDLSIFDTTLVFRALLRFHEIRQVLLDCLRLLLKLSLDQESDDDRADAFRIFIRELIQGEVGKQSESATFWRKCIDGLADIEKFIAKMTSHKQRLLMTGQSIGGSFGEWAVAQRALLMQQHEALAIILAYLIQSNYIQPEDYRGLLNKAAGLEADMDITIHYLPVLVCGAAYFGSDQQTTFEAARDLHKLFAAGPGQMQWKQSNLKAAATLCWLAEYNARFLGARDVSAQTESDSLQVEEAHNSLFFDSLKNKGLHFILAAAAYLKPVVWYDPSRVGMTEFLLDNTSTVSQDAPPASSEFAAFTMRELQVFADAFVSNMHDVIRELQRGEDDSRRNHLSQQGNGNARYELDLERFMMIMACAYEGDFDAAHDFWADRESNLYGFLRWVSQRLPTPRVAAFCQLLKSIASDEKSAAHAHRFLLEETSITSGKGRKAYGISWAQIFSELDLYASSLKNRPVVSQPVASQDRNMGELDLEEPETGIMLDSYLGLAAHVCRASSDARTWLLRDQPFHLGEVLFQLAQSALVPRVRACCLDMLVAMLTDKITEVRNGIWALLDSWIAGAGQDGTSGVRLQSNRHFPSNQYLQAFTTNAETAVSLVNLLNSLLSPTSSSPDVNTDLLPFPENLGASHRQTGIDIYVDFVMDSIFARQVPQMLADNETSLVSLLRYQCLNFVYLCLSTFNEDLILLANTTNVAVESILESKSLANYIRLHPFARVMQWMCNKGVLTSFLAAIPTNPDEIAETDENSPFAQATLKALQVLNLIWKLQPTYFEIVKPHTVALASPTGLLGDAGLNSIDEVFLQQPRSILDVASLTTCKHAGISLESLSLLQRIGASRKLAETPDPDSRGLPTRLSNRVMGILEPSANTLAFDLQRDFVLEEWDLESDEIPLKLVKARAVLDLLAGALIISDGKPSMAHSLLGFSCDERGLVKLPHSTFSEATSLFHAITSCAVSLPIAVNANYTPWLIDVKCGCLDIISRLSSSPLSSSLVQSELRSMDFLPALSQSLTIASSQSFWDFKISTDPMFLLDDSASTFRGFMRIRELFFILCAVELRTAHQNGSYSVQEKLLAMLRGKIQVARGEQAVTASLFDLSDFLDIETSAGLDVQCVLLQAVDLSSCLRNDSEAGPVFDLRLASEVLRLSSKEIKEKGKLDGPAEQQQIGDERKAILAALTSQNSWQAINGARLAALETWTNLLSLMVTKGGLNEDDRSALALQGLSAVLPRFERLLTLDLDGAALLAKATLTLVNAIHVSAKPSALQTASTVTDRLLGAIRSALKAVIDSNTDLAFRDVCYRIGSSVLAQISVSSPASGLKQLYQLVQTMGDRLTIVITEDTFAGRGITRVSALLFLDSLAAMYQSLKLGETLLKGLTRLNFTPVLIESSIGSIKGAFRPGGETTVTIAYFHTAITLLLRLCRTSNGAQLVLTSGLFVGIDDSHLFTTDPDIGLDVENPIALREFYHILADILRVISATVVAKGPERARAFLQRNRAMIQAIFKQTSKGVQDADVVAEELSRLILMTDFLEDDVQESSGALHGFT